MDDYKGAERRQQGWSCPLHDSVVRDFNNGDKRMQRYEDKIDKLIDGQNAQALAIEHLMSQLSNGIRHDLTRTMEGVGALDTRITLLCSTTEARLSALEKFTWFRDWMNRVRDHLLQNLVKLAFIGALVYLVTHFGDQIVKRAFQ
jgi:hypothetical protein